MTEKLKHFLKGVGSVVDLAPSPRAHRFIPRDGDTDRLRGDLDRIGADMNRALGAQRRDDETTRRQSV